MSNQAEERLVVQVRVLGAERTRKKRRMKVRHELPANFRTCS